MKVDTNIGALVGEFMVAYLLVFIASRTAVNFVFFIRRWHAFQLVRRSSLISPRTGFNSVCIRESMRKEVFSLERYNSEKCYKGYRRKRL